MQFKVAGLVLCYHVSDASMHRKQGRIGPCRVPGNAAIIGVQGIDIALWNGLVAKNRAAHIQRIVIEQEHIVTILSRALNEQTPMPEERAIRGAQGIDLAIEQSVSHLPLHNRRSAGTTAFLDSRGREFPELLPIVSPQAVNSAIAGCDGDNRR